MPKSIEKMFRATAANVRKHDRETRINLARQYSKISRMNPPVGIPVRTGKLRASETAYSGGAIASSNTQSSFESIGRSWNLGDDIIFMNTTHYAGLIARRARRSRKRLVGSKQNPDGYHFTINRMLVQEFYKFKPKVPKTWSAR